LIGLHCHIIPGIHDGSPDLQAPLKMARLSVGGGVSVIACTPHTIPGVYENSGPDIRRRVPHIAKWMGSIVASDAHDASQQSPAMGPALRALIGDLVGLEEAENLVRVRPAILEDRPLDPSLQFPFRGQAWYDGEVGPFFSRAMRCFRV
jgi:tyrosine-protein phosphatase YwqE